MNTNKSSKFGGFLYALLPMVIGLIIQFTVSIIGIFIISIIIGFYAGLNGIEDYTVITDEITKMTSDPSFTAWVSVAAIGITVIVFGIWYYKKFSKQVYVRTRDALKPLHIILLLIVGVLVQISMTLALDIILPLFPSILDKYMDLMNTIVGGGFVVTIILTVVLAPIAEECMFRGIMFKSLSKIMPLAVANIIQALCFGIYHLNIVQGVYAFLIGLVLGFVVIRLKSIWASILLHAAINASGLFVEMILPDFLFNMLIFVLAAILVCVVFSGFLMTRLRAVEEHIPQQPVMEYAYAMPQDPYSADQQSYYNNWQQNPYDQQQMNNNAYAGSDISTQSADFQSMGVQPMASQSAADSTQSQEDSFGEQNNQ